jgi:dienelactone hydrolase
MTRRLITLALTFFFLACGSSSNNSRQGADPSALSAEASYSPQAGDMPVGVIPDGMLRDTKRQKDVELSIEYPISSGTYPLIVWSHGFGGSPRGYVGFSSWWASHGYVVIKPAHADSGKLPAMKSIDEIWGSQTPADWRNRVDDVKFVLDSIPQLEEKYPELKGKIDAAHVGVGGHSYGAYTAMLIGGVKTFPGGMSYADPRVKAVIAMSPQGPGADRGLTEESFATLSVPALFLTGTLDRGANESETPEWRRRAFELSPAGDKYLVVLKGARHATFGGRVSGMVEGRLGVDAEGAFPNVDPTRPGVMSPDYVPPTTSPRRSNVRDPQLTERAIVARAKTVSVAFWDGYLHGNNKGRDYLGSLAGRTNVEMLKK